MEERLKNELDSSFFNQQFVPERHKLLLCQMRNRIRGFLIDPLRKRSGMEEKMEIRRAEEKDMEGINRLLRQVLTVHHVGRPDLFKGDVKKYTDEELRLILKDDDRPVFVGVDEDGEVLGYAFCILQQHPNDNILTDIKTLYIDDLCVDEKMRGRHIGKRIYEHVLDFAGKIGCYNVTLNVWACNPGARAFYEKCGLIPQKFGMEKIL